MTVRAFGGLLALGALLASCGGGRSPADASTADAQLQSEAGVDGGQGDQGGPVDQGGSGTLDGNVSGPPPPPEWLPPPGVTAEPGWRESTVPVCSRYVGRPYKSLVWGDSRGVFLMVATSNNVFAGDQYPSGWSLLLNEGSGWSEVLEYYDAGFSSAPYRWAGFDGAPLWVLHNSCMIRAVDVDEVACLFPAPFAGNAIWIYARYAPDALVYVQSPDLPNGHASLRRFVQGSEPETLVEDYRTLGTMGATSLWSDGTTIVFAHGAGITVRDGAGTVHPPVPLPAPFDSPLEVAGPADAWYTDGATATHLGHYDGTAEWTTLQLPAPACPEESATFIRDTYESAGTLWVLRRKSLYRWKAGELTTVLDWDCDTPQQLDTIGGSPGADEVYVVLLDPAFEDYQCGGSFILWSDGVTTRRF